MVMSSSDTIAETVPDTLADIVRLLGKVPLDRVLARPAPGTATEDDVIALLEGPRNRRCELIRGILVEKAMGSEESFLALYLGHLLWTFLEENDVGLVFGADGPFRLLP